MIKQNDELQGIQILRGVAAVAVLVHHTLEVSNGAVGAFSPDWLTTSGASGVDIFFVISGFIMIYVSFPNNHALSPRQFLTRRALRIYPFYWFCCIGILSLKSLGFMSSLDLNSIIILKSLFLIPSDILLIGLAWTLIFELYFYFIFASTLLFNSRKLSLLFTFVFLAVGIVIGNLLPSGPIAELLSSPLVFEFLLGMALGFLFVEQKLPRVPVWVAIPMLALLFIAPLYVAHDSTAGLPSWQRVISWGLPSLVLCAAFLHISAPQTATVRFFARLGDASYAIYLTHGFVMIGYGFLIKRSALGELNQIPIVFAVSAFGILFGTAAHFAIEAPMNKRLRRFAERRSAIGPARSSLKWTARW